jgi:hypothetical protein
VTERRDSSGRIELMGFASQFSVVHSREVLFIGDLIAQGALRIEAHVAVLTGDLLPAHDLLSVIMYSGDPSLASHRIKRMICVCPRAL